MKVDQMIPASVALLPSPAATMKSRRTELPHVADQRVAPKRLSALRAVPLAESEGADSVWEPAERAPSSRITSSQVIHAGNHQTTSLSSDVEARLVELIAGPVAPAMSHHEAGAIREARVCAFIAELGAIDVYHLARRLRRASDDDALVIAFRRLIPVRRQRIFEALEVARRASRRTAPR